MADSEGASKPKYRLKSSKAFSSHKKQPREEGIAPLRARLSDRLNVEAHLNRLICEYLTSARLSDTLKSLTRELKRPPASPSEPLIAQLFEAFNRGDREAFAQLWQKTVPSVVRLHEAKTIELEFKTMIYFALFPCLQTFGARKKLTPELCAKACDNLRIAFSYKPDHYALIENTTMYFVLPFLRQPHRHPLFRRLFDKKWTEDLCTDIQTLIRHISHRVENSELFILLSRHLEAQVSPCTEEHASRVLKSSKLMNQVNDFSLPLKQKLGPLSKEIEDLALRPNGTASSSRKKPDEKIASENGIQVAQLKEQITFCYQSASASDQQRGLRLLAGIIIHLYDFKRDLIPAFVSEFIANDFLSFTKHSPAVCQESVVEAKWWSAIEALKIALVSDAQARQYFNKQTARPLEGVYTFLRRAYEEVKAETPSVTTESLEKEPAVFDVTAINLTEHFRRSINEQSLYNYSSLTGAGTVLKSTEQLMEPTEGLDSVMSPVPHSSARQLDDRQSSHDDFFLANANYDSVLDDIVVQDDQKGGKQTGERYPSSPGDGPGQVCTVLQENRLGNTVGGIQDRVRQPLSNSKNMIIIRNTYTPKPRESLLPEGSSAQRASHASSTPLKENVDQAQPPISSFEPRRTF